MKTMPRRTASFLILLAAASPLGLAAEPPGGLVAILHEPGMPVRGAASSAPVVGRILDAPGMRTRLLSARQLADPAALDASKVDLLVLPTGQSFPVAARENLIRFLRGGGDLIHLGGYAFENLLYEHQGRWCNQEEFLKLKLGEGKAAAALFRPLNTARGKPLNELKLEPEQIGMFDACFPLKRACRLATDSNQRVIRGPLDMRREVTGWAASGIVGDYSNNGIDFLKAKIATNARWVPLLQTYDRYDRPRGAAAAMLLNFGGFYAGSSWAYFGVDNFDLCADPAGPGAQALQDVARFLVRGTFLGELTLPKRLLRDGESLEAVAVVRSTGKRPQAVRLSFAVGPAGKRGLPPVATRELNLKPGEVQTVRITLPRVEGDASLGQVVATLQVDGQPIDELATGYVVDRPDVMRSGADLRFRDNYFTRSGRPMFLFGSDETAYVYLTPHENPLTWSRDLLAARDTGMNLYENLQYSRPGHAMGDADWRNIRAMAQLTQQHNLVFMPGMLVVHNVIADDNEVSEESRQCEGYARLLSDAPGCLLYLNGDYVSRPDPASPEIKRRWNEWLRERYGSTVGLRKAWGDAAPPGELGALALPGKVSTRWDDPVIIDWIRFLQWMTTRWNQAHLAAVRKADTQHPITSEYYQAPSSGLHMRLTMAEHDVANTNLFLPVEAMPTVLRWNDMRTRGKGLSVGEYGMRAHPAWTGEGGPSRGCATPRTDQEQSRLFTAVAHYGLGLGGAKIQNWCLRDAQHRSVHAWGIFYAEQMVPKDVAYLHRNLSMIWRHFTPKYTAPTLAVCIPTNLGQGNKRELECGVAYRAFSTLFELHYDFNVVDDEHLESLTAATKEPTNVCGTLRVPQERDGTRSVPNTAPGPKTLVYPAPFAVSDRAYARLLAWVRAGGSLLVTGDFSFDENRRRTRTDRLKELAGVEFVAENFPNVARESGKTVQVSFTLPGLSPLAMKPCLRLKAAGAEVLGVGPQNEPVMVRNRVGRGTVYYTADAQELSLDPIATEGRRRLYNAVLHSASQAPLAVEPNEPWLQTLAQPTARGAVHVVMNTRAGTSSAKATLTTPAGPVTLSVRDGWPAMAAVTTDGRLVAALADAKVAAGGSTAIDGTGMKGVLSLDGRDVRQSQALLVAPWEPGVMTLPAAADRVAVVGDFREGQWVGFEQIPLGAGSPRLDITADRATCLILVCPKGDVERRGQQLTDAMLHPERIEGY